VRSIDKIVVGNGKCGPVTKRLQREYLDIVTGAKPDPHGWLSMVRASAAASPASPGRAKAHAG
jgi:branched-chain amino acid aminotransferase